MGLLDKIKNVLFEEEEVEISVTPKNEVKEEKKKEKLFRKEQKREAKEENVSPRIEEKVEIVKKVEVREEPVVETPKLHETHEIDIPERDEFAAKTTFEFPVFDESDFEFEEVRKPSNIRETIKNEPSKKLNFGKYENISTEKPVETKTFKPSPVISPVYGVLDTNFKPTDIKERIEPVVPKKNKLADIDSIRNKAYGTLEDEINDTMPTNEVIEEFEDTEPIPTKSIDDLLLDSTDELITVGDIESSDNLESNISVKEPSPKYDGEELTETLNILDDIEQELDKGKNDKEKLENDTLENDLFNLIDSMYDNREGNE